MTIKTLTIIHAVLKTAVAEAEELLKAAEKQVDPFCEHMTNAEIVKTPQFDVFEHALKERDSLKKALLEFESEEW